MLALAQGTADLLVSIAFIAAAVLVIWTVDRIADYFWPERYIARHPSAYGTTTGLVRVLPLNEEAPPEEQIFLVDAHEFFDFELHA